MLPRRQNKAPDSTTQAMCTWRIATKWAASILGLKRLAGARRACHPWVRVAAAVKQGTEPEALGNFRMLRWDLLFRGLQQTHAPRARFMGRMIVPAAFRTLHIGDFAFGL